MSLARDPLSGRSGTRTSCQSLCHTSARSCPRRIQLSSAPLVGWSLHASGTRRSNADQLVGPCLIELELLHLRLEFPSQHHQVFTFKFPLCSLQLLPLGKPCDAYMGAFQPLVSSSFPLYLHFPPLITLAQGISLTFRRETLFCSQWLKILVPLEL